MKRSLFAVLIVMLWESPSKAYHNPAPSGIVPARVDISADAQPKENWGMVDIDERGNLKHALTLILDYAPESEKTSGTLPRCHNPLDESVDLGEIICTKGNDKVYKFSINNVAQDCYTNPSYKRVRVAKNLELRGCQSGKIMGFKFNPPLRLNVERK